MKTTFVGEISILLRLFGILGWLPARVDSGRLTLKIKPVEYIYAVLAIAASLAFNSTTIVYGLKALFINTGQLPFLNFLQVVGPLLSSLVPGLLLFQSGSAVRLCNSLLHLQELLEKFPKDRKLGKVNFKLRSKIIASLVFCALLWLQFIAILPLVTTEVSISIRITYASSLTFCNLAVTWWICIFRGISALTDQLVKQYKILIKNINKSFPDADVVINHYRSIVFEINNIINKVGKTTHLAMAAPLLLGFIGVLFGLYEISGSLQNTTAFIYFIGLLSASLFILLCELPHRATKKVHDATLEILRLVMGTKASRDVKSESISLLIRLSKKQPRVTFNKYIAVDRSLLAQIVPGLISGLIVLLQLNIAAVPISFDDFFHFNQMH